MANNGAHEASGFTHDGNIMIADVAARVLPIGWASKITNRIDGSATILLFRPDGSEYAADASYADSVAVRMPDEIWWDRRLREALESAAAVVSPRSQS